MYFLHFPSSTYGKSCNPPACRVTPTPQYPLIGGYRGWRADIAAHLAHARNLKNQREKQIDGFTKGLAPLACQTHQQP